MPEMSENNWMLQSLNTLYLGQIRLHVLAKNYKPYYSNYESTKRVYCTTVFQVWGPHLYNLKYTCSVKDIECLKHKIWSL